MNERENLLSSLRAFRGVALDDVRDLARRFELRWYEPGEWIVRTGAPSDRAYLVVQGQLSVQLGQGAERQLMGEVRAGELTGETALFMRRARRGASLLAQERTGCLLIEPRVLRRLHTHPAVVSLERYLLHSVARRLRECNQSMEQILGLREQMPGAASSAGAPQVTLRDRLRAIFSFGSARAGDRFDAASAPARRPAAAPPVSDAMSDDEVWRRMDMLLAYHPYVLGDPEPILNVLSRCASGWREPGALLCREGDPGGEMFFILEGQVRVQKTGRGGAARDLAAVQAPAMLGQMSLIDRSRRSATCSVGERSYISALGADTYAHFIDAPTPEGSALRRLMLSSLSQQLLSGNQRVQRLIEGEPTTAAQEIEEIEEAIDTMEGFGMLTPPPQREDEG